MFRRVIVFWLLATSVAVADFPRQFHTAYGDDSAGNPHIRTTDFLVQTFAIDGRNQLSNVVRSGPFTVTGSIPATVTNVTVNGAAAIIYNDLTFAALTNTLVNGTNSFTIIATGLNGAAVTNSLSLNLPVTNLFQYDANGNQTNDGTRICSYDAENQLTNVFASNAWRVGFVYDGLNRRRIERDYAWSGGWVETNEIRFVYDGHLAIQERDTNNNPQVTYDRGLDLSRSLQGAGGIGGLLARTDASGTTYYHADGTGNVTTLMDGSENIVARYKYGPYGQMLGQWGAMATVNRMGFSSKWHVPQADIYDFGYRWYPPNLARWLNRDPIGVAGGINLYGFAEDNPVNYVDPFGLQVPGPMNLVVGFGPGYGESVADYTARSQAAANASLPIIVGALAATATGGLANAALVGAGLMTEASLATGFATGAFAGLAGDAAAQGTGIALGNQQNFSLGQLAVAGALGGALGAAGNTLANALKPNTTCPLQGAVPTALPNGSAYMAAVTPSGQLVTSPNMALSHAAFAQQVFGATELPSGAWIGTIGKIDGQVVPLNSMTYFGNQGPANATVQQIVSQTFK